MMTAFFSAPSGSGRVFGCEAADEAAARRRTSAGIVGAFIVQLLIEEGETAVLRCSYPPRGEQANRIAKGLRCRFVVARPARRLMRAEGLDPTGTVLRVPADAKLARAPVRPAEGNSRLGVARVGHLDLRCSPPGDCEPPAEPPAPRRHHPRGRPGRRRSPEGSAGHEGGERCSPRSRPGCWSASVSSAPAPCTSSRAPGPVWPCPCS